MTIIRLYANGEPARADVLSRPLLDILSASGVDVSADFKGFALASAGFYDAQRVQGLRWLTDPLHNADRTGVQDSRAAFASIEALAEVGVIPPGVFRVGSNLTLAGKWFIFPGARIRPSAGVTVTIDPTAVIDAPSAAYQDISEGGTFAGGAESDVLAEAKAYADSGDAALQTQIDGKASSAHTHAIADVTNLQASLDGKASTAHTHAVADVTGLQTALDAKADTGHTHSVGDLSTTGTPDASTFLRGDGSWAVPDGGSADPHTHEIADVNGLQTALDGKAASAHTHSVGDLTTTGTPDATTFLRGDGAWSAPAGMSVEDTDKLVFSLRAVGPTLLPSGGGVTGEVTIDTGGISWSPSLWVPLVISPHIGLNGRIEIGMPADGQVIQAVSSFGAANLTVAGGRIPLKTKQVLMFVPPFGTSGFGPFNSGTNFRVVATEGNWPPDVPEHWIPIAARQGETWWFIDGTLRNVVLRKQEMSLLGTITAAQLAGASSISCSGGGISWTPAFRVFTGKNIAGLSQGGRAEYSITMPPDGTVITGAGGASNVTVSGGKVPLAVGMTLFYILPYGSGTATPANFRIVPQGAMTSGFEVPNHWIPVCIRGTGDEHRFLNGIVLHATNNPTYANGLYTSYALGQAVRTTDSPTFAGLTVGAGGIDGPLKAQRAALGSTTKDGTGGAFRLNFGNGSVFLLERDTTLRGVEFTGLPATDQLITMQLYVGSVAGAADITWPASFRWLGGAAPTLAAAGMVDVIEATSYDGGGTWWARHLGAA